MDNSAGCSDNATIAIPAIMASSRHLIPGSSAGHLPTSAGQPMNGQPWTIGRQRAPGIRSNFDLTRRVRHHQFAVADLGRASGIENRGLEQTTARVPDTVGPPDMQTSRSGTDRQNRLALPEPLKFTMPLRRVTGNGPPGTIVVRTVTPIIL